MKGLRYYTLEIESHILINVKKITKDILMRSKIIKYKT